ncbi:MAG TPA: PAS domain S-box protein [Bacteroidota bacterium]|nr:PAS domain S-box protein [Bacteroidota bacterium]
MGKYLKNATSHHRRQSSNGGPFPSDSPFYGILEAIPNGVIITDEEGTIVFANKKSGELFGYLPRELLGKPVESLVPQNSRHSHEQDRSRYAKHPTTRPMGAGRDLYGLRKDGHTIPVEIGLSHFTIDGRKLILASIVDISARKHAHEVQNRLASIVENASDAIVAKNLDGTITAWNAGAEKLFGYRAAEALGKNISILIPPDRAEEETDIIRRIRNGEVIEHFESVRKRRDGSTVDVSLTISPIRDELGVVTGVSKIARDISEAKRAEQALVRSETLLREMGRIGKIGGWELDAATMKQVWTDETYAVHDRERESYDPNSTEELSRFTPGSKETMETAFRDALEHGKPYDIEAEMTTVRGNRKWVRAVCAPEMKDGTIVRLKGTVQDITERKRAEEAVLLLQSRTQRFIDANIVGIAIARPDGMIVQANDYYLKVIGATRDEFAGGRVYWSSFTPTEWLPADEKAIRELHSRGTCTPYEKELHRRDGSRVAILITVALLPGPEEEFIGFVLDITDRKKSAQQIEFQASILDQIHNAVITTDMEGQVMYWNKHAESLYGWRADEVVGKEVDEFLVPQEQRKALADRRSAVDAGAFWNGRTEFLNRDGSCIPVHVYSASLRDAEGQVVGRNSVSIDIRDVLKAEEALKESEERFSTAFFTSPVSQSVISTASSEILAVNDACCRQFGYSREELVGATTAKLNLWESPSERELAVEELRRTGHISPREATVRTKSGDKRTVIVAIEPIAWKGLPCLISSVVDITDRKRAEEEVMKLNAELESRVAQRTGELQAANKELEAFSYSVSHDLRAPLRAMDGFSRILMEEYGPRLDEEARRLLEIVRSNSSTMGELIDDLLQFSRTGRAELRVTTVDMRGLALAVVGELQKTIDGRQVSVSVGNLPNADTDYAMMKLVFTNLLSNAFKFTSKTAGARIEVGSHTNDHEQIYYVKDNGAGFDVQYAHKLFGVFQRLHSKDEFEGTGIGLGIVKRIIEKHNGRVWAEGKVDEGATFYFALPGKGTTT